MPVNMIHLLRTDPMFDNVIDRFEKRHEKVRIAVKLPIYEAFIDAGQSAYPGMLRDLFADMYKNLMITYKRTGDEYCAYIDVVLNDFGKFELEHYLAYMYEQNTIFMALQKNATDNVHDIMNDICDRYNIPRTIIQV